MTNAERYLPELLHDAYCADNEGGSALYQVLPEQLRKIFYGEYDIEYNDENFKLILTWLKSEFTSPLSKVKE